MRPGPSLPPLPVPRAVARELKAIARGMLVPHRDVVPRSGRPPRVRAEPAHCDQVLKLVRARGLEHLRATRRGDLITLVSGDEDETLSHARLRRVAAQKGRPEK